MNGSALFSGSVNCILNAQVGSIETNVPVVAALLIQKKLNFLNDTHLVIQQRQNYTV